MRQVKKQLLIPGGSCKIIFFSSELLQKAQLEAGYFISIPHSEFLRFYLESLAVIENHLGVDWDQGGEGMEGVKAEGFVWGQRSLGLQSRDRTHGWSSCLQTGRDRMEERDITDIIEISWKYHRDIIDIIEILQRYNRDIIEIS